MADDFDGYNIGLSSPAGHLENISPNDSTDLTKATRGISIGGAGALKITTVGGETITIPSGAIAVGVVHPIRAERVFSTGTGATNIIGWW